MEPLCLQKSIQAPLSKVYEAWTSADLMGQWFFPGSTMSCEATCDFRVGGQYKLLMHDNDKEFPHHGEYREIVENKKLVFTWNSGRAQDTLVTLEFSGNEQSTDLKLTHELFRDESQKHDHNMGWNGCLGNLAAFVVGQTAVQT